MRRGATEDLVAKLADYERSDLPERTKAALRFADRLTDDELLDLGMTVMFFSGWQRFNEAFGIVPDGWRDGDALPFPPLGPGGAE